MTTTETHVNSVAPEPKPTASDRCDYDWFKADPRDRAFFWRCYLGGLALLVAAIFLFT